MSGTGAGEINGSAVESTDCSYREPRFGYEHPQGNPQLPVISAPGDPTPSTGLWRHTW